MPVHRPGRYGGRLHGAHLTGAEAYGRAKRKFRPFFFVRPRRTAGVTLVELVLYLLIVVVLVVLSVMVFDPAAVKARYQVERLRGDLRHMQMLALAWGVTLKLTTTGASYTVSCPALGSGPCAGFPAAVTDPATAAPFTVTLEPGLALSGPTSGCGGAAMPAYYVDPLGRPSDGTALLATVTCIVIGAYSVTVQPVTGFTAVSGP